MSSWQCRECRTVYPPGVPACPPCQAKEAMAVAKANAVTGSTHYVAEGDPVPDDLHPDVRLVGPGVIELQFVDHEEPVYLAATPDPSPDPDSMPPASSPVSSVLVEDYNTYPIRALRELVRGRGLPVAGSKAELVARLAEHDRAAVA